MNVVDSSAWLEYFAAGPNSEHFAGVIESIDLLLVLIISLCEVFKKVLLQRSEGDAIKAVAHMQQGRLVDLDASLAMVSARLSATLRLPMADSIMLATARQHGALLWTQDADFKDIVGVKYFSSQ